MGELDRDGVMRVLDPILRRVPDAEVRLVGTASSLLRGIDLRANDIDILFRSRAGVDAWCGVLACEPQWLDDQRQYFARAIVDDVTVELSTVEVEVNTDTGECAGRGPWVHFDTVRCGDIEVAAVATELRLITEVARMRPDRYRPILEFLRSTTCDLDLVRRGLRDVGASTSEVESVVAACV